MSTEPRLNFTALEVNKYIPNRNYWRDRLKGFELTSYFHSRAHSTFKGNGEAFAANTVYVPENVCKGLELIAPTDVSKHIFLLSCLAILIQRYSSTSDIAIFTPPMRLIHYQQVIIISFPLESRTLQKRVSGVLL